MDWLNVKNRCKNLIRKYKYIVLIIIAGVVLMMLPTGKTDDSSKTENEIVTETKSDIQTDLSNILSKIKGAGRVEVMLTVACGEETIYQLDEDVSNSQNGNDTKIQTVIVEDSGRNEQGLVRQICSPVYLGAIIICDGAEDPVVRLAIVDAVSKVTGLGANCISVLKMK